MKAWHTIGIITLMVLMFVLASNQAVKLLQDWHFQQHLEAVKSCPEK